MAAGLAQLEEPSGRRFESAQPPHCNVEEKMAKTIRWRCVNEADFVSEGIDFVEGAGAKVCHVEFVTDDGMTVGARAEGGVQIRPADYAKFTVIYPFSATVTDEQYALAWGCLMAQVGKPYDFLADAGILCHRNWREDGHWMCADLWTFVMETAKIIGHIADEVNFITPQHVLIISSAMFAE